MVKWNNARDKIGEWRNPKVSRIQDMFEPIEKDQVNREIWWAIITRTNGSLGLRMEFRIASRLSPYKAKKPYGTDLNTEDMARAQRIALG